MPFDAIRRIAEECRVAVAGVRAVVRLTRESASVPFIARYRKEQTGGLDEVQIRAIADKDAYYGELEARRSVVLEAVRAQGKLTPELEAQIEACSVRSDLEDLYLPFRPRRRTRASMARERGLAPLAEAILAQPPRGSPRERAAECISLERGVPDEAAALAGARDILAEAIAERSDVRARVRAVVAEEGVLTARAVKSKIRGPTKFESYYEFEERVRSAAPHRVLALRRGEAEGVLRVSIEVELSVTEERLKALVGVRRSSPFAEELALAVSDALTRLLMPSLEGEVRRNLEEEADRDAARVFAQNLRGLLLAPPLGPRRVLGVDPGQRTGCKCAALDETGKLLAHEVVNLVAGDQALRAARETFEKLVRSHRPFAVAVGNGTHGRETADFCRDELKRMGLGTVVVLVSESGASVYSASEVAREEFPSLDLTVRGAISIARRLQDPLAELVKLDPKAIGVGQYQHDVDEALLARNLDLSVESCVNAVGVELNTASASLLARVAGLGNALAKRIVKHRDQHGPFRTRKALLDVAGLGPKAFEQCAGFVRIRGGEVPLDASAVHPERYGLVARIARDAGVSLGQLVGSAEAAAKIDWSKYVSEDVGMPTLEDIRRELAKPGRDPRETFEPPAFRDDVRKIEDLTLGMQLEGVVTNVTAFGAFVDIGVHQDGLVHVSQLADRFVRDPHEIAHVGDRIRVRVLEVDLARKRIALSARTAASQKPP